MPSSRTYIATASGSRYLQQLCKHWAHKLKVEFTPLEGQIEFDGGRLCKLKADDGGLALLVSAADSATLVRTEGVVIEHLKRFAFREEFGTPVWSEVGADQLHQ
jgi:uncharacterized protein